jgi:hypothetical protein
MNKQQLFTAGSVLLATTALTGVANAGIIASSATTAAGTALSGATTMTAINVAQTLFSATAATANAVSLGPTNIFVAFSNNFTAATKFSMEITPVNAGFVLAVDARVLLSNSGSFLLVNNTVAASTACTSVTPLTTKIILDGCGGLSNKVVQTNGAGNNVSASYGGVLFSGVSFNNASGLASVGSAISVSGLVYNANNTSQSFESITAANVVVSAVPVSATVGSGGTFTANASSTPVAFSYSGTAVVTMALAYVDITGTGTLAADLSTITNADTTTSALQLISSIQVTVAAAALSQAAATAVVANNLSGALPAGYFNGTVANFSAGVATFSVNAGQGFTSFVIQVAFSGTTALTAASAGTVTVAFGIGNSMGQAVPTVTGKTGAISLGGFNAELNTFLTSANTSFSSFARIHNNGILAGTAIVTVRNDATGVTMGSYTTSSIATNQTLQISAKDIETGAGITAAAGVNYTLSISGAFSGYAQHIIFNPATGQLADLSAFRNRGNQATTSTTTAP